MSDRPWELDDDALFEAEGKGYQDWCAAGCPLNRIGAPLHKPFERRAIATAAQKRLVEWLEGLAKWEDEYCYWYIDVGDLERLKAALEVK